MTNIQNPHDISSLEIDNELLARVEDSLRVSEAKFRHLVESSIQGIVLFQDGRFVFSNQAMSKITGYSVEEMLAMSPEELVGMIHPEDRAGVLATVQRRLSRERVSPHYHHRIIRADGQIRYVEIYASLTTHKDRPAIQAAYIDITDKKELEDKQRETELALRRNEAQLRLTTSNMRDLIIHTDENGIVQYTSPSALSLWEDSPEEIVRVHFSEWLKLVHPADTARLRETFAHRLATGEGPGVGVFRIQLPDTDPQWYEYSVSTVTNGDGSIAGFTYVLRNVNQRMQAVLALQESEGRLRQAMNVGRLGIWEWNIATDETIWMGDMFRMYGISPEEFTGKGEDYLNFTHPEDREIQRNNIARAFESGMTEKDLIENNIDIPYTTYQFRISREDGTVCYVQGDAIALVDENGDPVRMLGVLQDVTEQRAVEEAMLQAQKLESLGVMAGSVAHDFNNLLTGILTNASVIEHKLRQDEPVQSLVASIIESAERAADITRQLLAYSGKGRFVVTQINLSDLIRDNINLLQATLPKNITLSFDAAPNLPAAEGDVGQIQQVIMNLIINAADAYDGRPGTVTLSTTELDIGPQEIGRWNGFGFELEPGRYICLTVEDMGSGMDARTQANIFDPFFTTKEKGRGLGLAAVQGIIRGHHGALSVKSKPQEGTHFQILLPISQNPAEPVVEPEIPTTKTTGHLILVVDDEEPVRDAITEALSLLDYRILTAKDGVEAVSICKELGQEINLVLLDMTMPLLSGLETIALMEQEGLAHPVVLMSGYDDQELNPASQPDNIVGFLKKPFRIEKLSSTISQALDN